MTATRRVQRSLLFFSFLILFFSVFAHSEERLISTSAGRVGDEILTSREVILYTLVENVISRANNPVHINAESVRTKEFSRETTAALVEMAVNLEAESFGAADADPALVRKTATKCVQSLKKSPLARTLEFDAREIDKVVRRKLRAKDFIRFKIQSATIPISDQEARTYFDQNRMKFENLPFESFKDNIKSYLSKQQVDRRLRDWLELLQAKYKVRNLLSGS